METRRYVLLYDRDCGICSAVGRWLRAADRHGRIQIETIQSSRDLLWQIPEARVLDAFHMIDPEGRISTGGDAVPTLIEAFPIGAGFARLLTASSPLMGAVHRFYAFLTRFRDRLVCRVERAGTSAGSGL